MAGVLQIDNGGIPAAALVAQYVPVGPGLQRDHLNIVRVLRTNIGGRPQARAARTGRQPNGGAFDEGKISNLLSCEAVECRYRSLRIQGSPAGIAVTVNAQGNAVAVVAQEVVPDFTAHQVLRPQVQTCGSTQHPGQD